jgi:hypothetical protein
MDGESDFFGKAFSVFVDMDKLVGGDFEQGLTALKTAAEADAKKREQAEQDAKAKTAAAATPPPADAATATP